MAQSTSEKEKFFAHLTSLDETESEDDNSTQALEDVARKRRKLGHNVVKPTLHKATTLPTTIAPHSTPSLTRASTDIAVKFVANPIRNSGTSTVAPIEQSRPEAIRSKSDLNLQEESARQHKGQAQDHKKKTTIVLVPGKEPLLLPGLFQDFVFYFIPNDDVNKVRRLRIQGAIAQGATWARELDASITHIIVDAEVTAATVAKFLNGALDTFRIAIVKDRWLVESLTYKHVRNTDQGRFQLQGASDVFPKRPVSGDETVENPSATPKPAYPVRRSGRIQTPPLQVLDNAAPNAVSIPSVGRHEQQSLDDRTPSNLGDALADIVRQLQSATNLPFDEEVDLAKYVSFESTLSSTIEPVGRENRGFQCMESHTGEDNNPNARTIEVLQKMASYYDRTGDKWRVTGYRKAITALRKQATLVKTAKEAQSIVGIGSRLAEKIQEIVTTDRLQRYESTLDDPNDQVLQLFMGIYDVGYQQAQLWISSGYRTLQDLKRHAKLTANQHIGIDHYDDFQQRIPREEVKKHGQIVVRGLKRANKNLEGIIGGSYRRGNQDSGDIDVVITHPTADLHQLQTWVFGEAVPYLFKTGFLKCTLATSRNRGTQIQVSPITKAAASADVSSSNDTGTKFHGASALTADSSWRRIDLLLTSHTEIGAAMIYFTGNDIFNRSLRLLASRKGMRLNQHGLYKDVMRGKGRVQLTEGELVEGKSERRIFQILGVPWREPWERKC